MLSPHLLLSFVFNTTIPVDVQDELYSQLLLAEEKSTVDPTVRGDKSSYNVSE